MSLACRLGSGCRFPVSLLTVDRLTSGSAAMGGRKGRKSPRGTMVNSGTGVVASCLFPSNKTNRRRRCLQLSPILCIIFSLSFGQTPRLALPIVLPFRAGRGWGGMRRVSCVGEIALCTFPVQRVEGWDSFVLSGRKTRHQH